MTYWMIYKRRSWYKLITLTLNSNKLIRKNSSKEVIEENLPEYFNQDNNNNHLLLYEISVRVVENLSNNKNTRINIINKDVEF